MRIRCAAAVLLCICLLACLCACTAKGSDATQPDQTVAPTSATEQTEGESLDYSGIYQAAREKAGQISDMTLTYTYSRSRIVGGETYTETSTGTAAYTGYSTTNMEALISEKLTFGTYETQYYRSYLSGRGYCRVNNSNFACEMTARAFVAQALPAVLLVEGNYSTVSGQSDGNGICIRFSDGTKLESWLDNGDIGDISAAGGTARINENGELVESSYHAEYTCGGIPYTLDVTVQIDATAAPDFSGQPVYPQDCAILRDLRIPALLAKAVGDLFDTDSITASHTDTLYSEAFALIRSQTGTCDAYGSGSDLMAAISSQVSVTDYTGTPTVNTKTVFYADGQYSYTTNGGTAVTVDTVSAEDMRVYCEDSILTALFSLSAITEAKLTNNGDYLYIEFNGSEAYADGICANVYSILGMDLDQYAASYQTPVTDGYLAMNRYTGLPTAMGLCVERSHSIDGVTFRLRYQLDQSLQLPSGTAYETLTGITPEETAPTDTAAPLFYRVTGENGQEMWLLGTIHVGDERTGFLPDAINEAFSDADALAVEFDTQAFGEALRTDPALQADITAAYYYADGSTAQSHLAEDTAAELTMLMKISGNNSMNTPYMKVAIWQSLLEDFFLSQGSVLSADRGMDNRLITWASEQNKPIYDIESGLAQIRMLTGFSDGLQQQLLQELLEEGMDGYCAGVAELYELWCGGDESALTVCLSTDTSEMTEEELALWNEYNEAMYTDRNQIMLDAAQTYLESGETVFYAVGIAHLLGEDGIVQALRDAGYTVELVIYE